MFSALIFAIDSCCTRASIAALLVALYVERFRFWFTKRLSRWSQRWRTAVNGVRLLVFDWLHHLGSRNRALPPFRRGWNRTPRHIEEQIVQLHVAHPQLGAGQLKLLVKRILGVVRARETVRAILMRNRDVIARLRGEKRGASRRIAASRPNQLWGIDLTLVRLLAI